MHQYLEFCVTKKKLEKGAEAKNLTKENERNYLVV